ncbi:MAG TPA: GNAT family N-acetyltransferase [Bacteroidia bacterium]|nr:GNAT family N-acetyltransferase [Bacteroidia bacterium]
MEQPVVTCKVENCLYSNSSLTKLIFNIRQEVFVKEQKVSREEEFDAYEQTSVHYLASYEGVPAGTARWRITDNGIKLERFAVLITMRGKGIGNMLLKKVLHHTVPAGLPIYLHAQVTALTFYERAGFKKEGPMFSEANIDHFKMMYNGPDSL